ncbi:hypothetical protein AVP42_00396 [Agromyces sp. NDB4Y10]|uniref:hypothetical protein n=1 Tax=Agromyces sp. NDB4Y10 TaxID=1775951 RepID=UPI0007B2BC04|nr:hypothetical protein [Agromyces sp. NDB4Y10]KZE95283.1 hypothetical protein AVP42_00396 [Agromyces sp. NDB4Y10]
MRARAIIIGAAGLAVIGSIGIAGPAVAAENGPNPNASCVGVVFQPQATGSPGAIAARVAEIKGFGFGSFGSIIGGWFVHQEDCYG